MPDPMQTELLYSGFLAETGNPFLAGCIGQLCNRVQENPFPGNSGQELKKLSEQSISHGQPVVMLGTVFESAANEKGVRLIYIVIRQFCT